MEEIVKVEEIVAPFEIVVVVVLGDLKEVADDWY